MKRQLELDANILESLSDSVFVIDTAGKIIYANERAVIERGYSKEELLRLGIGVIDSADHQVDAQQMVAMFAEKKPFFLRTVHQRKDKSIFPIEASIRFISIQGEELAISVMRDITKQAAAEAELRASEEKYRQLVQNSLVGIFRTTFDGQILYANQASKEILGYDENDDETHYNIEEVYEDKKERQRLLAKLQKYGAVEKYEIGLRTKNGRKKTGLLSAELHDNIITGVLLDITDRIEATQRLLELSQIVEQVDDLVLMTDTEGKVTYVNDAFVARTGFSRKEVLDNPANILKSGQMDEKFYKKLWAVISSGKTFIDTFANKKKDGEIFYEYKTITPIKDTQGEIIAYVSSGKDITERINMEERLKELSEKDHLTGLYNRLKIEELLENNIKLKKRYDHRFSLIMIDIDHFKSVNDKFGHDEGDKVLIEFANVLKRRLRTSDVLGRWGGEEFIIILPHTTFTDAAEIAETIRKALNLQLELPDETHITISAGVCEFEENYTMQQMVKKTDEALYKAKNSGRNCVVLCNG